MALRRDEIRQFLGSPSKGRPRRRWFDKLTTKEYEQAVTRVLGGLRHFYSAIFCWYHGCRSATLMAGRYLNRCTSSLVKKFGCHNFGGCGATASAFHGRKKSSGSAIPLTYPGEITRIPAHRDIEPKAMVPGRFGATGGICLVD